VALIELQDVVKRFDERAVLAGVNLAVNEGDVKVVMGPSGCGKSTLLRCINRLVEPTSGSIRFRGQEVTGPGVDVRALRLGIGFVFQQFALYRHLSVIDNVTLALRKLRGMSRVEAEARAMHELNRLGLAEQRDQYPAQISGGQKQRAAIARALAVEPSVLLLDEPLLHLDPLERLEMRAELKSCLARTGITTFYATNDQAEAMGMADRVAVMQAGHIMQVATPGELYRHPACRFVAGLVGAPPMNLLTLDAPIGIVWLGALNLAAPASGAVVLGIRPEDLVLATPDTGFAFRVRVVEQLGSHVILTGETVGQKMRVVLPEAPDARPGSEIHLRPLPGRMVWMDAETGVALAA